MPQLPELVSISPTTHDEFVESWHGIPTLQANTMQVFELCVSLMVSCDL